MSVRRATLVLLLGATPLRGNGRAAGRGRVGVGVGDGSEGPFTLAATDGHELVNDLDIGPAFSDGSGRVRLSGSTLTWSPDGNVRYSAPLGGQLLRLAVDANTPPPTPLPPVCSLIAAADVQAVLGPVTATSAPNSCAYTTNTQPASAITVTLQANLTPAQVAAAERTASRKERSATNLIAQAENDSSYRWSAAWETTKGSISENREVQIVGDVQLNTDLVTPAADSRYEEGHVGLALHVTGEPSPTYWESDVALQHFADLAFDRLMGWPVRYVGAG
jgi:hypothetical protein